MSFVLQSLNNGISSGIYPIISCLELEPGGTMYSVVLQSYLTVCPDIDLWLGQAKDFNRPIKFGVCGYPEWKAWHGHVQRRVVRTSCHAKTSSPCFSCHAEISRGEVTRLKKNKTRETIGNANVIIAVLRSCVCHAALTSRVMHVFDCHALS